jgi:hypothetical protein
MEAIRTRCPRCSRPLEIPLDFDDFICASCGTAYEVRKHKGAIRLLEKKPPLADFAPADSEPFIESRLAELEDLIEQAHSEIEAIRSIEQSAPLQLGCAFFGLFMMVIVVIALFILMGKGYFGHWLFYASVAAVILLGLARIRRNLTGLAQIEEHRRERRRLEHVVAQLETERDRVGRLRTRLSAQELEEDKPRA